MNKLKILTVLMTIATSVMFMVSCGDDIKDNSGVNKDTSSKSGAVVTISSQADSSTADSNVASNSKTDDSASANNGNNAATNQTNNGATNNQTNNQTNNNNTNNNQTQTGKMEIVDEINLDEVDSLPVDENGEVRPDVEEGWGPLM